jgi:hypothetical protein
MTSILEFTELMPLRIATPGHPRFFWWCFFAYFELAEPSKTSDVFQRLFHEILIDPLIQHGR